MSVMCISIIWSNANVRIEPHSTHCPTAYQCCLNKFYAIRSKSIIFCLFTPVTPIFEPCLMAVAHGFKNLFEIHFVRRHIFKQYALVEVMPVYKQIINRKW